jgi:nucleoside-diphosphate-sugar epimerase
MIDTPPEGHSLFRLDLDHIARHGATACEALSGASILITGGTGFFGMWLVEGLLWADTVLGLGLDLTVLSRDPARFAAGRGRHLGNRGNLQVIQGDIASFRARGPFSHVIHAAVEGDRGHVASVHLDAALNGTRRIVELASEHRTKAVLFTSSGAVYHHADPAGGGRSVEGPGRRGDYTDFKPSYAETKRMSEFILAAGSERHGFRAAIARCFAFAGAYLPLDGGLALGNFLRDAMAGRDITVGGDGTALRSYLYGADLVVWLLTILARGEDCRPYNVGGDEAVSIGALAGLVADAAGRPGGVVIRQAATPGATPQAYLPDVARATGELGLRVHVDLREAVRRSLEWCHHAERG